MNEIIEKDKLQATPTTISADNEPTFARLSLSLVIMTLTAYGMRFAAARIAEAALRIPCFDAGIFGGSLEQVLPRAGFPILTLSGIVGSIAGILLLRRMPPAPVSKRPTDYSYLLNSLFCCAPLALWGIILGIFATNLLMQPIRLLGFTASAQASAMEIGANSVNVLQAATSPIALLITIIVTPIIDEYIFRRLLIDRSQQYGERTAMEYSAIAYALCSGSLLSFFYAWFIGRILACVYLRTGRLRWPVIMQMIRSAFTAMLLAATSLFDSHTITLLRDYSIGFVDMTEFRSVLPRVLLGILCIAFSVVIQIIGHFVLFSTRTTRTVRTIHTVAVQDGQGRAAARKADTAYLWSCKPPAQAGRKAVLSYLANTGSVLLIILFLAQTICVLFLTGR
jgi:membrane protease YdiL (CAAX protease family)